MYVQLSFSLTQPQRHSAHTTQQCLHHTATQQTRHSNACSTQPRSKHNTALPAAHNHSNAERKTKIHIHTIDMISFYPFGVSKGFEK